MTWLMCSLICSCVVEDMVLKLLLGLPAVVLEAPLWGQNEAEKCRQLLGHSVYKVLKHLIELIHDVNNQNVSGTKMLVA